MTPRSSDAVALTVTVPLTVAPAVGLVSATVGAARSFRTVTLMLWAVWRPLASRATAAMMCAPLRHGRRRPRHLIRCRHILGTEGLAIQLKLHARYADVIGSLDRQRHEAAHDRPGERRRHRDGRRFDVVLDGHAHDVRRRRVPGFVLGDRRHRVRPVGNGRR